MFQVKRRATSKSHTVYAVHKSGPRHEQTKFLVFADDGWRWEWAVDFEPLPQPELVEAAPAPWQPSLRVAG